MKTPDHLPFDTDYEPARRPDGRFGPGNVVNPNGRPRGSQGGRTKALALLDQIIGEEAVQVRIGEAMRQAIMDDPMKFFRQIVMPLLPAESKHEITTAAASPWVSLVDVINQRRALEAQAKESKS